MENDSTKSESIGTELGLGDPCAFEGSPAPDPSTMLLELVSSIRKIEEYLVVGDAESRSQDAWPFVGVSSSFYYWLKETYKRRVKRSNFFNPEYFGGEASWNILLDLAASQIEGKLISISSACIASQVPPTTALRWITILENDGMIHREGDLTDRRRSFIRLSDRAMDLMYSYYKNAHSYPINRRKMYKE